MARWQIWLTCKASSSKKKKKEKEKMAMLDDGNSPSPAYNNALMEYVG